MPIVLSYLLNVKILRHTVFFLTGCTYVVAILAMERAFIKWPILLYDVNCKGSNTKGMFIEWMKSADLTSNVDLYLQMNFSPFPSLESSISHAHQRISVQMSVMKINKFKFNHTLSLLISHVTELTRKKPIAKEALPHSAISRFSRIPYCFPRDKQLNA